MPASRPQRGGPLVRAGGQRLSVVRRCLTAATLLVATMAAPWGAAQFDIADNKLRTEIIDLGQRLKSIETTVTSLDGSLAKLGKEQELLRNLIAEITELATLTESATLTRQVALQELAAKITTSAAAMEREHARKIELLDQLITGMDGATYARALVAYGNAGDPVEAVAQLDRVAALGARSSYATAALHWIGRIHYEQGEFDAARVTLTSLLKNHPGHLREADTLYLLAEMANLLDDPLQETWRERLLRQYPTSLAASRARTLSANPTP